MNHDYAHCFDYKPYCPKDCFRAQLARDLENRSDLKGIPLTYANFKGTKHCTIKPGTVSKEYEKA